MSRGIQNKNPANLRISDQNWKGKVPEDQNTDGTFEQFTDPVYGLRALAVLLRNYYNIYGLNTIRQYITKFAPSSENPLQDYIDFVCKSCNAGPDDIYNVTLDIKLDLLMAAIVQFENGVQPYSEAQINEAIALA
jgi:hypothetical protein